MKPMSRHEVRARDVTPEFEGPRVSMSCSQTIGGSSKFTPCLATTNTLYPGWPDSQADVEIESDPVLKASAKVSGVLEHLLGHASSQAVHSSPILIFEVSCLILSFRTFLWSIGLLVMTFYARHSVLRWDGIDGETCLRDKTGTCKCEVRLPWCQN